MQYLKSFSAFHLLSATMCVAQAKTQTSAPPRATAPPKAVATKLTTQQKFVLDVIQTAVALPQGDQQDRLRVLTSAANVVGTVRPALANQFAKAGVRIEQDLISAGET